MLEWLSAAGPSVFWLAAMVVLLAVEAATVGLVSIWFAAGALCAFLVSLPVKNIWVQIVVFLVISFVCMLAVRPLARKYMAPRRQATNADRAIGAEAVVTQDIDNLRAQGQVQVQGAIWTARSALEEQVIPAGAKVRVERIEGVKLIVTPLAACPAGEKKEEE